MAWRRMAAILGSTLLVLASIAFLQFAIVPFRLIPLFFLLTIDDPNLIPSLAEEMRRGAIAGVGFAIGSVLYSLGHQHDSQIKSLREADSNAKLGVASLLILAGCSIVFAATGILSEAQQFENRIDDSYETEDEYSIGGDNFSDPAGVTVINEFNPSAELVYATFDPWRSTAVAGYSILVFAMLLLLLSACRGSFTGLSTRRASWAILCCSCLFASSYMAMWWFDMRGFLTFVSLVILAKYSGPDSGDYAMGMLHKSQFAGVCLVLMGLILFLDRFWKKSQSGTTESQ